MRAALLMALVLGSCASPRAPRSLQQELEQLAAGFDGVAGIYVERFASGEACAVRADETFPSASLIKLPILLGIFAALERGDLEWRAPLAWDSTRKYSDEDLSGRLRDGARLELAELVALMCGFSDNGASLWCQELAGGGQAINSWLADHGFERTRVNSRTPGREEQRARFGWGQTTPREMARLLATLARGETLPRAAREEMLRALSRSRWTGEALSEIPPEVHVASKQGAVERSRSEVLWVDAPHGPYVLCVITREQQDTRWEHDNSGFELLRSVSRAAWRSFEPESDWEPPAGRERWY